MLWAGAVEIQTSADLALGTAASGRDMVANS